LNTIAQKNTLLKNAQANATGNFLRECFFSLTQRRIFSTPFFLYFSPPHLLSKNTTSCASNVKLFDQSVCKLDTSTLRTDRRASGNMGLAKVGL